MPRLRPRTALVAILLAVAGCGRADTRVMSTAYVPSVPRAATPAAAPGDLMPEQLAALAALIGDSARPTLPPISPAAAAEAIAGLATIPAPQPQDEPATEAPRVGAGAPSPAPNPAIKPAASATPASAPVTTAPAPPPTAAPPPPPPPAETVVAGPAGDLAGRLNALRAGRGLPALARDGGLDAMAAGWAQQMARTNTLAHSSLPQQMLGRGYTVAGENVGYGPTVQVVHDALTASPGHLSNMVGTAFTRVGVAVAVDGNGRLWVVQLFGG